MYPRQIILLKHGFGRLTYGYLTLIGSGSVNAALAGNDKYFAGTLIEIWVRASVVPRNTATNTVSETMYKRFSVHPHMARDKLTNPRFNRSIS